MTDIDELNDPGSPPTHTPTTALPTDTESRRVERAVAVFGTWMITGLFLDGWAHNAGKPETFFSPYHGVLYSGFIAGLLWAAWESFRSTGIDDSTVKVDRLMITGLVLFVTGAVGDGLWHEIFGVEADLEALVSPSHLALFFGGFLMVSSPLRLACARRTYEEDRHPQHTGRTDWVTQGVTLTLSTALVAFFTQYLSPFEGVGGSGPLNGAARELDEIVGVSSVLVFNALLVVAMLFVLRRWRPPLGFGTLLYGAVAIGMAGLEGFELAALAVPAVVAGAVADLLIRRAWRPPAVVAGASLVLWGGYFAVADTTYGLAWSIELWSGTIVLACASSLLLAAIVSKPRPVH